jgi:hypothetical protein
LNYLLVHHKVANFETWHSVFASHAKAQQEAGLRLLHLLRVTADPNDVLMLFEVNDPEKAEAFTGSSKAGESAKISGVIGTPEVLFLTGK